LGSFLHANGTRGGDDDFTPTGYLCPTVSISTALSTSLTEADVQNVLKSIYETTGTIRDYDLLVGPTLKRVFTNFTQSVAAASTNERLAIKSFNQSAESKSFINVIDVYEGDFGRLRLHPTTHISSTGVTGTGATETSYGQATTPTPFKGYVIPFDKAEIRYGKLPQIKELTDNGGGPARMIEAMAALVVHNPSSYGFFNGAS